MSTPGMWLSGRGGGALSMSIRVVEPRRAEDTGDTACAANPLRQAAATWRSLGGDRGLLLHGQALAEAEDWAARHGADLGEDERDLLRECREAMESDLRRRRQAGLIRCVASIVAVAALVGFGLAWSWRAERLVAQQTASAARGQLALEQEAKLAAQQTLAAESEARVLAQEAEEAMRWDLRAARGLAIAERSRALSGLAVASIGEDRELAILLGVEAAQLAKSSPRLEPCLSEALPALYRALEHPGWEEAAHALDADLPLQRAWLSADGRALTFDDKGTARVWDAATGTPQGVLEGEGRKLLDAAWAPEGSRVALANEAGQIVIFDPASQAVVATFSAGLVVDLSWSPDGTRLLVLTGGRTLAVWELGAESRAMSWKPTDGALIGAEWDAEGQRIMAHLDTGEAVLLDAGTGDALLTCTDDSRAVWVDPSNTDARMVATEEGDQRLYLVGGDLAGVACARTTRNMTQAEWARFMGAETPYRRTCPGLPEGGAE